MLYQLGITQDRHFLNSIRNWREKVCLEGICCDQRVESSLHILWLIDAGISI